MQQRLEPVNSPLLPNRLLEDADLQPVNIRRPGEVRILSYNIFMRPPGISSDKVGDVKNERLHEIITTVLPSFDVICFQEVFTACNCRKDKLVAAAKDEGYLYEAFPPKHPFFSWHFIAVSDFCSFSHGSGVDGIAYKGIQYMRIMVDGKHPMNLFNLHMQAHRH